MPVMSTARRINSIWESCAEAQALVYASLHRSVRCGWIGGSSWIDALENSLSNSDFSSARFKYLDIMSTSFFQRRDMSFCSGTEIPGHHEHHRFSRGERYVILFGYGNT